MRSRKKLGDKPYLLFLGAGVSISSRIPRMNVIIDRFLIDFGLVNDKKLKKMDSDQRYEMFVNTMSTLSQNDRYYWLQDAFKNARPSAGYPALNRLVEKGYFEIILTTNWDSLLDKSLISSKKMIMNRDFRFYVIGVNQNDFIVQSFQRSNPRIKILKLHGEMDDRVISVTPKETTNFPKKIVNLLKDLFRNRDVIMIGYSVADLDVQECIERNRNTLICVNPKLPSSQTVLSIASKFKHVQKIDGKNGKFDVVMSKLSQALPR